MNKVQREMLLKHGDKCVCMDATHGLNPYQFEMTSIMVLDDIYQGFPCAFIFSNRTDQEMLEICLEKVRNAVGSPIHPKVFFSLITLFPSYKISRTRKIY